MAKHSITVKLNRSEMPKFRENLAEKVVSEIGPEMSSSIRDILVYKKMRPGQRRDWPSFMAANAGLFSAAIIDDMDKRYVKFGRGSISHIRVESYARGGSIGTELIIQAELTPEARKRFADFKPSAVFRMVTNLDPTKAQQVFRTAVDKAGLD